MLFRSLPFLAENPVDWWRRWHISLAQFFRDHVYYPLFFLLKEIHICVFVTFLANGLWHGLYLHYFYLGLYWAFFVNAYLLFQKFWDGALKRDVERGEGQDSQRREHDCEPSRLASNALARRWNQCHREPSLPPEPDPLAEHGSRREGDYSEQSEIGRAHV